MSQITDEIKQQAIDYCQNQIDTRYPNIYASERCSRDLSYLIDNMRFDIDNNTDVNTKWIAKSFVKDGQYEVRSTRVELRVYPHLAVKLKSLITDQAEKDKIDSLIKIMIDTMTSVDNAPTYDNVPLQLILDRKNTRSFSTNPVEYDKIQRVKQALIASPSKNNGYVVDVKILGPNATAYKEALYRTSECLPDMPGLFNPQILAPVVFLFMTRENLSRLQRDDRLARKVYRQSYTQAGLSAMSLCLAAEAEGLDTGFIGALDRMQSEPLIDDWIDYILFGVGVGYARTDVPDKRYRTKPQDDASTARPCRGGSKPDYRTWIEEVGF
tara:strand:- start:125 stop:1102 length:978 start_codon:yes stop_codon:yes gene_type:complete